MAEKKVNVIKKKSGAEHEPEFLETFMHQVARAKEKGQIEKAERRESIEKLGEKLRPSIVPGKEMRKKLERLSIEREKLERKRPLEEPMISPRPTPGAMMAPPTFARRLPSLPQPPKVTPSWPLKSSPLREEIEKEIRKKAEVPLLTGVPKFISLDLGKLNPFIEDNTVTLIQCDGADLPVKITKNSRIYETIVTLTDDEIKTVIHRFADRAGLALTEPIFKAVVGNMSITAITSTFAGTKFVIAKS